MSTLIVKIEKFLEDEANIVETRLEAIWQAAKPSLKQLGATEFSMVETAAITYAESGFTNLEGAVASVISQLPTVEKELEAIIVAAITATAVSKVATGEVTVPSVTATTTTTVGN